MLHKHHPDNTKRQIKHKLQTIDALVRYCGVNCAVQFVRYRKNILLRSKCNKYRYIPHHRIYKLARTKHLYFSRNVIIRALFVLTFAFTHLAKSQPKKRPAKFVILSPVRIVSANILRHKLRTYMYTHVSDLRKILLKQYLQYKYKQLYEKYLKKRFEYNT